MEASSERTKELIQYPQESLAVEIKAWLDPDKPDDIAKIIKTAIAMRNNNGGYIVIGFDNKTLEPLLDSAQSNVRQMFNIDKIQGAISKYSSELFEVNIDFPQRDGQEFPVIVIPTGVKTPVVAKSDLLSKDKQSKPLIREDTIYVRSLSSNNTPSTTQAKSKDWSSLMEICFDNREADIGRFIRRQLSGISSDQVNILATAITGNIKPEISNEDLLREYLQESEQHYEQSLKKQNVHNLPEHGVSEVGLILKGTVPRHRPNDEFLNLLRSSNPNYTGWPVWLDSRPLGGDYSPYVIDGGWEALLISLQSEWFDDIEFMRLSPQGKFFLSRAHRDDMGRSDKSPQALKELDVGFPVKQTAEIIAVGIHFAKALGCLPEETSLVFAFKWTKLNNRKLSCWAHSDLWMRLGSLQGRSAYEDECITFVNVPLDAPISSVSNYVQKAVQPLFEIFNGFTLKEEIIEDMTRSLIERKQ
ncbi:RNA-binding domain-containing protein [Pseudanabaena galeata UHCC 0370]|uniref:RNA-binding domain-containing protein n=1 Tax=Pseudanabaena galeata UHCC 0370 TaxID=3110310 RepID=A0ABU5TQB1_9CYAN|nr:RNA-binding domain-containing protein [Pseudanabaena galeata]MEA5480491.1 RNA-binding domain-containing protein [Pseudanabaena galeata UHCC 0370]